MAINVHVFISYLHIICKMTSGSLMYDTGNPKPVRWEEGFKRDMYTYGQFMLIYGKNHHNIIKYPLILKKYIKLSFLFLNAQMSL